MKRATFFVVISAICISACAKEQAPTIYGKWIRTEWSYYDSGVIWIPDPPMYPYILDFKTNNSYFIIEDTGGYWPEGTFHLNVRKRALVFHEHTRIIPYRASLNNEIQIVALESNLLWLKNDLGYAVKFKRHYE